MPDFFTNFYQAVIQNDTAIIFAVVLVALFLSESIRYSRHRTRNPHRSQVVARNTPPLFVSIGILGTFVGIFAGLLEFDVKDIDNSIPPLLEGLTLAFTTSIMGMTFALLFKGCVFAFPTTSEEEGATPDSIYAMLSNIRSSISGDEEASMVSQLQRLRTSNNDHLSDLKKSFEEFAAKMTENNTQALILALENVMKDFNAKINEQFGDNFKRLNEAVEALLTWQENYRIHVETLEDQFKRSLGGIEQARESLLKIAEGMSNVPTTLDSLRTIIITMERVFEDLNGHLEAFKNLREKAQEAFPLIEQRMSDMTENFSNAVTKSVSTIEQSVTKSSEDLSKMATTLHDAFEAAINESNEKLHQQIEALDKAMQEEVKRVVEVMGSHLASLSSKFVQDYGPLTDKLREVVRLAAANPK